MTYRRAVLPILILVVGPTLLLLGYHPGDQSLRPDGAATMPPRLIPFDGEVLSFTISPDNRTLAAFVRITDENYVLRIFDLTTRSVLSEREWGNVHPQSMEFSPDGRKLALMYWIRGMHLPPYHILLWDLNAERQLTHGQSLEPDTVHFGSILFQLAFSPDGNSLAAGTRDEVIYLWDTSTGNLKLRFQGGVAAGFSADGKTLFGVGHEGFIRSFDSTTGRHLGPAEPAPRTDFISAADVVFAPNGELAALGDTYAVLVKETRTNRTLCRVALPDGATPFGFTADGRTLAVRSEQGTHLIDTATGGERAWVKREQRYNRHFAGIDKYLPRFAGKSLELRTTAAVLARGQRPPLPAITEPPGVALEAELTAVRSTYVLDLDWNTREDFATRIHFGEYPDTPAVDLLLTLRNTGREVITLDGPAISIHLLGNGALNTSEWFTQTGGSGDNRLGPIALLPGYSHTVRVTSLNSGIHTVWWLLPGEYSVVSKLHTAVSPAPKWSQTADEEDFGEVTIRCAPVKIEVIEVAGPPPPPLGDHPPIFRTPAPGTRFVPKPPDESDKCQRKLQSPVNLSLGFDAGTPLNAIVDFLADRFDFDIRFDSAAFKAAGKENFEETKTGLAPQRGASLSVVLHLLLDSVDADLEVRKDAIWIVPLARPKSLVERLEIADKYYRNHLKRSIDVRNRIPPGTTLEKALEVVGDHSGLAIVLDVRAFERAGIKDIARQPVQFADSGEEPVNIILDKLLRQVNAAFSAREGAVIVFPRK